MFFNKYRYPLLMLVLFLALTAALTPSHTRAGSNQKPGPRVKVGQAIKIKAEKLQPAPAEMMMQGSIYFRVNNRQELDSLLVEQQDPHSVNYHNWLTPQQFGEQFGASSDDYQATIEWLRSSGVELTNLWPSRLALEFRASTQQIEQMFDVRMGLYDLDGQTYYATEDTPQIPARLASAVLDLKLNNLIKLRPMYKLPAEPAEPAKIESQLSVNGRISIGPKDLQVTYNFQPLLNEGIDGSGQKIGIVARTDFKMEDVDTYREQFNQPPARVVKIPAGGEIIDRGGGEQVEVLLDTQLAGAAAPGATIQVVIADRDSDIDQSLAYLVNVLPETKIISISFNLCERDLFPTFQAFFQNLYKQAAAQGQTIFVASGDDGSNDCGDGLGQQVGGLSSSPLVTAVGGTSLSVTFDDNGDVTSYQGEKAWTGSGGGISLIYPRPDYQNVSSVPASNGRVVPDVSLLADPSRPGFFIIQDNFARVIGGTSASAPIWAGIFALANQFAGADGLGSVNPRIYQLGAEQQTSGATVFNDVIEGENTSAGVPGFPAVPGYDLSTGWGTPNVDSFVRKFAALPDNNSGLFLLSPTGGEIYQKDEGIPIRWRVSAPLTNQIISQTLLLSTDSGQTYNVIADNLAADTRGFDFTVTNQLTTTARFRVLVNTKMGTEVIDSSDTDINLGTNLRIEFARYSLIDLRIEMIGSGFSPSARLIVNGVKSKVKAIQSADDSLIFKGKAKKFKLKAGENSLVLEIDGVRSSPYKLSF